MLDQLVESKSHAGEDRRRGGFMATVLVIAVFGVLSAWGYDLFSKDFGMGGDDLSLTTLVAPVPVPDEEPPPEPEKKPEQQKEPDVDVRKELIQNMMQTPVKPPDTTSTTKNTVKEMRLDRLTKLGSNDSDTGARVDSGAGRVVDSGGTAGISTSTGTATTGGDDEGAPPPPKVVATPKPVPKMVSQGVLNGKATSLPKPAYPAAAKAVRAGGGKGEWGVVGDAVGFLWAWAEGGHPLLRAAAESAARGARFSPTLLSGQPVKVSGVITYNFVP